MARVRESGAVQRQAQEDRREAGSVESLVTSRFWMLSVLVITIATVLLYLPVFDAGKEYTNWDDEIYVVDQPLAQSVSWKNIVAMFNTDNAVAANYHPLTMLSLGATRELLGTSARAQAGVNLLLHLATALLVLVFMRQLVPGNRMVGVLVAFWFAIHPMHVESVAWISERKDVLYAFLLLCGLNAYVRYLRTQRPTMLVAAFMAFVASCLAKAMAVPMVVAMVLLDHYHKRPVQVRSLLEKLPFLAVALWVGFTAIAVQKGAISSFETLTLAQRFAYAGYGFVMYWVKMVLPFGLSAYYPYPATASVGMLPVWFYLMPVMALVIIIVPIMLVRRQLEALRVVAFGMGFFVLFVALVLQFVSVGHVVMADRYTYVPYIGSLFLLAWGLQWLMERQRRLALTLCVALSVLFAVQTARQVRVWKNSETLWSSVIALYPYEFTPSGSIARRGATAAYGARAMHAYRKGRTDQALQDLQVIERAGAKGWKFYQLLGVIYGERGQYAKAVRALSTAIAEQPGEVSLHYNRAVALIRASRPEQALDDYRRAVELGAQGARRYESLVGLARTSLMLNRFQEALTWCEPLVQEFPQAFDGYFLRGTALVNLARPIEAAENLQRALNIRPSDADARFNLSIALRNAAVP